MKLGNPYRQSPMTSLILGLVGKFIVLTSLLAGKPAFAMPPWAASNTQQKIGNSLLLVCIGEGPSLDLARAESINTCKYTATEQLVTEINVKTLSVETEKDVAFHNQISKSFSVEGLICVPQEESIEEVARSFRVWVKCLFDLTDARIVKDSEKSQESKAIDSQRDRGSIKSSFIEEDNSKGQAAKKNNRSGSYRSSSTKRLSIASVPQCDSIIVQGIRPRVVPCSSNPVTLLIEEGDNQLVIRATGYTAKVLKVNGRIQSDESIQVIFN